ncbi:hypothetical protein QUF75_05515 [Desulfococcaceae bacterium HSG7]|nr:hypothetical protein [Desulfococcaceae bacterium HSG7]
MTKRRNLSIIIIDRKEQMVKTPSESASADYLNVKQLEKLLNQEKK